MESGAGKQKDGIWKTNFGRKEEVVAYGIGLLVFLEKQWKCGNAYVTIFSKHYISNNLICLLRYSAVSENLTAYQRKISMLLFTENRNKCREVEQRCAGRDGHLSGRPPAKERGGIYLMKTRETIPSRTYKATVFAMLFQDKEHLLELYNAVSGKHYTDPEMLEINTLENAIYMAMKNDLSFIIDARLSLYEHQSTYSPNLPFRFLLYIANLFSSMTKDSNLYGTKPIELPSPRFIVFYNGLEEQPDRKILRLSDLYTIKEECIREGILKEFLEKNRAEAKNMSIFEYDQEKHMRQEMEEAWEEGKKEGKRELLCKLIQKKIQKGKTTAEIAEDLEEPEEVIAEILQDSNCSLSK